MTARHAVPQLVVARISEQIQNHHEKSHCRTGVIPSSPVMVTFKRDEFPNMETSFSLEVQEMVRAGQETLIFATEGTTNSTNPIPESSTPYGSTYVVDRASDVRTEGRTTEIFEFTDHC
jgi:hypothetical protein